jgi:branched-chain amino acid transport system substrate-binding protein
MRSRIFPIACALVPLLLGACAGGGTTSQSPRASGNDILIGVAGPMSGDLAVFGEQLKRGAQQAVADLNAEGGVLGKQVRLVLGDDQCDPKRAVLVANDLAKQGIVFVDGHFCSGSSIPASAVYGQQGVLQITPASTNPRLTEAAAADGVRTVLRTCGQDNMQGTFAGKWIAENYAGRNVAILDDGSPYGKGVADEAARSMATGGLKAALRDSYEQKQHDFSTLVDRLKGARIDLVYIGGYHNSIGLLVRQASAQSFKGDFAAADALATSEFWSIAGSAGEGVRYTDASSQINLVSAKSAVEKFRAANYEPEGYTLGSYAAVQAWAAGAEIAGSTDPLKVAEALRKSTVPTVIGDLSWDDKGDLNRVEYAWFVWHRGRITEEP